MYEIVGLLMLGAMFGVLEFSAPWLQRRRALGQELNSALEGLIALVLVVAAIVGGTVIFIQIIRAIQSGDIVSIMTACAAAVIGIPVVAMLSRWLGTAAWQGMAAGR